MKLNLKLLNLKRRREKYISFILNAEPKAKKTTKNKNELQKTIIEKLRSRNWVGLRGKIALEITAYSGQQNPPQIEKFVKNIVDIMHKRELLLTKEDEAHLPFKDDNYIKYLHAKYVFLDGDPSIHIKIRPFNSFISDIHFVRKELDSSYYGETSTRSNWEDYKELIDGKEAYLRILSNEAYENMIMLKTLDLQKEICDAMSITPHLIEILYPKKSAHLKALGLAAVYRQWASMLLDVPIRIHLPGIPLKEGDDEKYKKKYMSEIKRLMIKYLADIPFSLTCNLQS